MKRRGTDTMIAILILAGGQATRFGGMDKAFLPLQGQPLIAHLLARLTSGRENRIAISANGDAGRFASYHLPVLSDAPEFTDKGPLAGVAAGLSWAQNLGADTLLTIPVDTPFIPRDIITRLSPAPAVACYQEWQHHLVALWPTAFLAQLQEFMKSSQNCRVRDALTLCAARQINFTGANDPFFNINTPKDLEAAEHILSTRP
jgi:molybdopterin-guanine dinucleotide biosynthesis protein A